MQAQANRPTWGWDNHTRTTAGPLPPAVDALPHRLRLTSGRAALWAATQVLGLAPGSRVLVPCYHCPTLIAPLRRAGCELRFYALADDGLPDLARLTADGAAAIVVPQLFGLPRSLAAVRAWCDTQGVALIEDCAHSFFGMAGERPVGHWGDVATASLSKFFPVTEGGLLASARPLHAPALRPAGLKQQLKAGLDVVERAVAQQRLTGLNHMLGGLFRLKNGPPRPRPAFSATEPALDEAQQMQACDLGRCDQALPGVSRWLFERLPRERIAARRQANYRQLHQAASGLRHGRPLFASHPLDDLAAAPYAMPLWVEAAEADRAYQVLREAGCAVFRWDRLWPGTPRLAGDPGQAWQRQVLQLLCHQDLRAADLAQTTELLSRTL